nr:Uncharacterised protein [Klebsiella pneumoniae]
MLLPGGGWRLTRPTKPKQLTRQAQRRRARSRFMPGGGWRLTRPTKLKQQVRHAQRRRALQNTPLLTLRLAGEALLRASHGSGQSQTFSSPSAEIPPQLPRMLLRFTGSPATCRRSPAQNHKGRDKYRQHRQPPKSSRRIFSSSTPRSLSILITAAFITGGPHVELAVFRRRVIA